MKKLAHAFPLLAAAAALVLAGCAATGPAELPELAMPSASPPAPAASAPAPTPTPTTTHARPAEPAPLPGAPGDTVPSPAARAVLASIPEPLGGAAASAPAPNEAARPRGDTTPAKPSAPPVAAPVTTSASANPDSTITPADTADVPVPAPTTPLGAGKPAPLPETPPPPASTPPPTSTPPAAKPAPSPPASAPVAAVSDTCWRVQVGAPAERVRGSRLCAAAQSQLLVPMVVVREAGRWKVRTKDCLSRRAAESLRDRAVATGFKGVFLVRFVERP